MTVFPESTRTLHNAATVYYFLRTCNLNYLIQAWDIQNHFRPYECQ